MTRWLALALALVIVTPRITWAKGDKKSHKADKGDDEDSDDDSGSADDDQGDDEDTKPKKHKAKAKAKERDKDEDKDEDSDPDQDEDKDKDKDKVKTSDDAEEGSQTNRLAAKQDLTGHDLGAEKKTSEFEKDRFFVDKVDSEATSNATLIQGSVTWTNFAYSESGGNYPAGTTGGMAGPDASSFNRYFTDFRLQTDFRHISKSRWDARIDTRMRLVADPPDTSFDAAATGNTAVTPTHIQSGLTGGNEYELRELWLVRNGEQTDVTIGRQFITDLAAIKIDGLRIDYASSPKVTFLGFGGLYPLRGSRSISTDYIDLKYTDGTSAGQLVGATGFGGAYRTAAAYGAVGGVALLPLQKEGARVFGTSNGYWRYGTTIDLYHFAVIDLIGNNDALGAGKAGLTNLSAGVNYKPNPRLRLTGSFNRVDTETLNVQAGAFLSQPTGTGVVSDEVFIKRLSTTEVRGSLSAGLGELQRFQFTTAISYRMRPGFTITQPDNSATATIKAGSSVEVYASITDRRSIKDLRLSLDGLRTFSVDSLAFQRSEVTAIRGSASSEIKGGQGELEAEVAYASNQDHGNAMGATTCADITTCFGATSGSVLSLGGTLYYRFNRDWFGIGSVYMSRTDITPVMIGTTTPAAPDPTITGYTGFARLAYRF